MIFVFFGCESDDEFRDVRATVEILDIQNGWVALNLFDLQDTPITYVIIGQYPGQLNQTSNPAETQPVSFKKGDNIRITVRAANGIKKELWSTVKVVVFSDNKKIYSKTVEPGTPINDFLILNDLVIVK
jgi:hypothetical protein